MSSHPASTALAAAGALAVLAAAGAGGELDPFMDDVEVRVVNVDVVVTDKQGGAVTGLGREDFELLVDGEPVEIRHFAQLGERPPPSAAADDATAPTAAAEPRPRLPLDRRLNLVLYLDRAYLHPGDLEDLGAAVRQFLALGLGPGDRVMLVAADRQVEVLQSLTEPTAAIDALLAEELAGQGRGLRIESEYRDILRSIDQTLEEGTDLDARYPEHHTQSLMSRINAFNEEAFRDVELTGKQLRQVIAGLAGVPGRTVVLYVGGRMPVNAGQTLFAAWQSAFGRNSTRWQTRRNDPEGDAGAGGGGNPAVAIDDIHFDAMAAPDSNVDAGEIFERTAHFASALGVRFYTLDASALRTSRPMAMSRGSRALAGNSGGSQWDYRESQRVQSQGALAELAEVSGGRSLGASRDFPRLLDEMRSDLEAVYSLGFEPPEVEESSTHRIEVRLERPHKKHKLRYRQYFRALPPQHEAAERTLSALLFGATENPLGAEVVAGEAGAGADDDGAALRVPLTIRVPVAHLALVAESRAHSGRLTIFVTSGDLERGAAPVRQAVVPVRIANEEILGVLGRQVEYTFEVEVERGARAVAVGVRDDFAPLLSTFTLPLAAAGPPGPTVSP